MPDPTLLPDLKPLHLWFDSFCASFRSADREVQRNFDLKEVHTRKVCEAARKIAQGGDPRRSMLAEVAALCHDLGRFPQYREYRTFKDSDSVNHAHLSAEILKHGSLLDFLPKAERETVTTAVRLHNVYRLPPALPAEVDDLVKVLRDADKLDIWRVFIDCFGAPEKERPSAAALGFPDLPVCTPEVLAEVLAGKMVQLTMLNTLNDFKLLQLSWVYDINFQSTFMLIYERGLLDQLAATLPKDEPVIRVVEAVKMFVRQKVASAE